MTPASPDLAVVRANKAKQLLEEPLIKESFERLEQDIFEAWSQTGIRDKEGQHELLLMIQTARKFKALFTQIVQTGELAQKDLQKPKLTRVLGRFGI